mgnify:CR=1 FL=1
MNKYSVILGNLGNTCDRFLSSGYKDQPGKEDMLQQAAGLKHVSGIELVGSWDITENNVGEMQKLLKQTGMKCSSIIPDHFAQKRWGNGAFTSREPAVRREAINVTKEMIDAASEIGCSLINIWNGQDGYDYPFQGNFDEAHAWLLEAVCELADYRPEIRIALEYKPQEPRNHSYFASAANTLLFALETQRDNVGVTIDTGHAMMGGENMAESAELLLRYGKLFHMHFNDNYRNWDNDMIVGSIHHVEYIELLYWLRKYGYSGWYSMDQYPYREEAAEALSASIETLVVLEKKIDRIGMDAVTTLIQEGKATEINHILRNLLLGQGPD